MTHFIDQQRRQFHWRRWSLYSIVILIVVLTAMVSGWKLLLSPNGATPTTQAEQAHTELTTKMLFVGDVFWGRAVQRKAEASGQGPSYITSGLTMQDRHNYDAWIANFECPVTNRDVPYYLQAQYLKFNCRPEYLPELSKWFTAVTLANNHMENNGGAQGLRETRSNLEQQGIQYTGNYDMNESNDICEVVVVPARASNKPTSLPIALCGYMYVVDVEPTDAQLAVMQEYAKVMPVISLPHMGIEYLAKAEPQKVAAYRRMIDNGADMVIGAHPHVIQNSESYHGKLIAYSVGNFLFDQQTLGRETTLGLGVALRLSIKDPTAVREYQKLGSSCRTYKDVCLTQLKAVFPQRPAIRVSYDYTCYDEVSGVPRRGDAQTCSLARKAATVDDLDHLATQW